MMHKAWRSVEEVPYCFSRSSIKFHGHTGGKIDDLNPDWDYQAGRSYQIPQICLVKHLTFYVCASAFLHTSRFALVIILWNVTRVNSQSMIFPHVLVHSILHLRAAALSIRWISLWYGLSLKAYTQLKSDVYTGKRAGPFLNTKTSFPWVESPIIKIRRSIVRSSYLYNGNIYTGKTATSLREIISGHNRS